MEHGVRLYCSGWVISSALRMLDLMRLYCAKEAYCMPLKP